MKRNRSGLNHRIVTATAGLILAWGSSRPGQASGAVGDPRSANGWSSAASVRVRAGAEHPSRQAVNVINGSGLDPGTGLVHDNDPGHMWLSHAEAGYNPRGGTIAGGHWIEFGFDRGMRLDRMVIWNYAEGDPLGWAWSAYGMKQVTIQYTTIAGGGPDGTWGSTNPADWRTVYSGLLNPYGPGDPRKPSQTIRLKGIEARFVVITSGATRETANWMSGYRPEKNSSAGLSEVRFYAVKNSEPSSTVETRREPASPPPARAEPSGGRILAENGKVRAVVVAASDDTESVRHAARELADFLGRVTGGTFPVVDRMQPGRTNLLVGVKAVRMADPDFMVYGLGSDGIVIATAGENLILAGGEPRGTLYAVYTFLEDCVGCRWWSATESTIPHRPTLTVGDLDIRYVPPFEYREITYHEARDADYSVRNKLNGHGHRLFIDDGYHNAREDLRRGGRKYAFHKSDKWSGHTFYTLIPPEIYFNGHPEWFAEVNPEVAYGTGFDGLPNAGGKGKRAQSVEQCKQEMRALCLTRADLQKELVRNARLAINWSPVATWFAVGQIDGMNACRCDACMKVVNAEGAYAGLLLHCVNGVAEDLARHTAMPIYTFAYHYTRKPPKHVRPRDNVIVNLVVAYDEISTDPNRTGEISFSKPLTDPRNKSFRDDLAGWAKICNRLYIYDYAPNFSHPVLPHPNLRVLGPNLKLYADRNVKGVSYEAIGSLPGAELAELRSWMLAKLMWNPNQDGNRLIDEFCRGYFGPAGPHVRAYLNVTHDAIDQTGEWLHPGWGYDAQYLSFETLAESWKHLHAAERAVQNDPILRLRVQSAQLPVIYAVMMNWNKLRDQSRSRKIVWFMPESLGEVFNRFMTIADQKGNALVHEITMTPAMEQLRKEWNRRKR